MNSTMFNAGDILETIRMIQDECLDIRTTTMGISLLDCIDPDINTLHWYTRDSAPVIWN